MRPAAVQRLAALRGALDGAPSDSSDSAALLLDAVAPYFVRPGDDVVWLALAVLNGKLPVQSDVVRARREFRLNDPRAVLEKVAERGSRISLRGAAPRVRVVIGATIVDVHHTATTGLATGIQRVARKTLAEWLGQHDLVTTGWTNSFDALRELSDAEKRNAAYGTARDARVPKLAEVVVPWRSDYILPELAIETERTARIAALAEFSGNRTFAIGFDCVPLTSAETTGAGMGAAFSRNLVAIAHFDRVATISRAAAVEYSGWRLMLGSAGLTGPQIDCVFLPAEAGTATAEQIADARTSLGADDRPLVLCVGSHEPRKNHLATLAAAELLWASGREFSLAFVGGNAWGSDEFLFELERLQDAGRPVRSISAITDELLWGGYHAAAITVFPSTNEGFGLPVAESLAVGTPVVTSNYGSMLEIAQGGGAVLVDPRDDRNIAAGIERALFAEGENARLRAEAAARPSRGWPDYATELWAYFVANG